MSINCLSKHHIFRLNGDFCWMFPNVRLKLATLRARTLSPPSLSPRRRNSLLPLFPRASSEATREATWAKGRRLGHTLYVASPVALRWPLGLSTPSACGRREAGHVSSHEE